MTERKLLDAGSPAPDFSLLNHAGKTVTLASLRGKKVILYFYPAAMTPGCTKQACDFRDNLASLQAAGYVVLGVSPDKPAKLQKFVDHDALTFDLLSDPDNAVQLAYGAFGEKSMYGKVYEGTIRSTFVIDEAGVLTHALYNVKATGHVAMLRKQLGLN